MCIYVSFHLFDIWKKEITLSKSELKVGQQLSVSKHIFKKLVVFRWKNLDTQ